MLRGHEASLSTARTKRKGQRNPEQGAREDTGKVDFTSLHSGNSTLPLHKTTCKALWDQTTVCKMGETVLSKSSASQRDTCPAYQASPRQWLTIGAHLGAQPSGLVSSIPSVCDAFRMNEGQEAVTSAPSPLEGCHYADRGQNRDHLKYVVNSCPHLLINLSKQLGQGLER